MATLRILGISGSLRKASTHTGMLRFIQSELSKNNKEAIKLNFPDKVNAVEFQIADISKLPLYNEDIDNGKQADYESFREIVSQSDAFIFATPEYNFSISAAMKNAIDVASRGKKGNVWQGKAGGLISTGGAAGGARSQLALTQTFGFVQIQPAPGFVTISRFTEPAFNNETGDLISESRQKHVMEIVQSTVDLATKLKY